MKIPKITRAMPDSSLPLKVILILLPVLTNAVFALRCATFMPFIVLLIVLLNPFTPIGRGDRTVQESSFGAKIASLLGKIISRKFCKKLLTKCVRGDIME